MNLVVIESPWAAHGAIEADRNVAYARAAMRDCLIRGEAPFASHMLYAASHVLNDASPNDRELGMEAGFAWGRAAELVVVYTDLGLSNGMRRGIERALAEGRQVEYRRLGAPWAAS